MKQKIHKTFKYKLKLTRDQQQVCAQFAGASRFMFNKGLGLVKKAVDAGHRIPSYAELANLLPLMKAQEGTEWLALIHSQVLQQSLIDLSLSIRAFFVELKKKKNKRGFPKFKKKGQRETFRFPQGVRCEEGKVYLPNIGWVSYRDSRPIEGTIKQTTVKCIGGKWYICITCSVEREIPKLDITEDKVLGIDVGIKNYISTSDGRKIDNPRYLNHLLGKLRFLSKSLSRKKRLSKNWFKIRNKLQRLYIRISNLRRDFLHKLSTVLTKSQGVLAICIEDLNIKGMVQNRRLARAISDAGWGILYHFLQYKCEWLGKKLVRIDRYYPSSKTCSSCGNKQEMALDVRVFDCAACGLKLDRDSNASINIRLAGTSKLLFCGEMRVGGLKEAEIRAF